MENGHLKISWPGASRFFYVLLCGWLKLAHGLRRSRRGPLRSLDGSLLMPDFVGDGFRLRAGWSQEDGYFLLARDEPGDRFLERVFARGGKRRQ